MSENADILTNATQAIERLRDDERRLEGEIGSLTLRLEMTRMMLGWLTTGNAPGKPRKPRRVWSVVGQPEEPPLFDPPAAA